MRLPLPGQYYAWQRQRRGTPALDLLAHAFIQFLQNHHQVANSARGERLHALTTPGRLRALTALLLGPTTPLLLKGQEFAASAPFLCLACHGEDLDQMVRAGRSEFLEQLPNIGNPGRRRLLAPPADEAAFRRCSSNHAERERHAPVLALHRDRLRLRRKDPVFAASTAAACMARCWARRLPAALHRWWRRRPHGRRHALVLPRDGPLRHAHRRPTTDDRRPTTDDRRPATGSRMRHAIPTFISIVEQHRCGTRFNVGVDAGDGLPRQGAEGCQLTWMNAKEGQLGGGPAARQGGGAERAVLQRAVPDGALVARGRL